MEVLSQPKSKVADHKLFEGSVSLNHDMCFKMDIRLPGKLFYRELGNVVGTNGITLITKNQNSVLIKYRSSET